MVICGTEVILGAATLWERLKPIDRARVGMALLAFVLLFAAAIFLIMIAGRMVRRETRKPLPPVRDLTDAWAKKPLGLNKTPDEDGESAEGNGEHE